MTEDQKWMEIKNTKNVQVTKNDNRSFKRISERFDFDKCSPYIDKIKTLFVPSLENRIYTGLEDFVYRDNASRESELSYLKKCINLATSWSDPLDALCEKYKDVDVLEEATKHFLNYGIKDGLITSFVNSIVLNNRLNRVCRELDSLHIEKNLLSYANVWNFITEKNYWVDTDCATSASSPITDVPVKDLGSDLDVETGSGMADTRQEERRAPKRSATYEHSSNLKLEHEDEDSLNYFEVNEDLLTSLKDGSNMFSGLSRDKTYRGRSSVCTKSSCLTYRTKHPKADWKNESLKLHIMKMYSKNGKGMRFRKSKKSSRLALPCKYEDLLCQIIKEDLSLSVFDFSVARKKFENGIYNVTSCLNNVISRLDGSNIKEFCLFCEIRQDYIKFKLKPRGPKKTNVCLFVARVATYKELSKRTRTRDNKKIIPVQDTETEATEIREDITRTEEKTDNLLKYDLSEAELVECDSHCRCPSMDLLLSEPLRKDEREDALGCTVKDVSYLKSLDGNATKNRLKSKSVQTLVPEMSSKGINIDLVPKGSAISLESNVTRIISFTDPSPLKIIKDSRDSLGVCHQDSKCRQVKSLESLDKSTIHEGSFDSSRQTLKSHEFNVCNKNATQANSESKKSQVSMRVEICQSKISFINKDVSKSHLSKINHTKSNVYKSHDIKSINERASNSKPQLKSNSTTFEKFIKTSNFRDAFSTRSIDKIKYLIRTKLCRRLLERDKSTNTSKTLLSNDKNYKSTSNGRTGRSSSTKDHSKSQKSLSTSRDKSRHNVYFNQLPGHSPRLSAGSDHLTPANKKSQVKNQSIKKSKRIKNTRIFENDTEKNYFRQIRYDRQNYSSRCSCYYGRGCNYDRNNFYSFTCNSESSKKFPSMYTSSRQVLLPQDSNDPWYTRDGCQLFKGDYHYGYGVPYYPLNFYCEGYNKENATSGFTIERNETKTDTDSCQGTEYRPYLQSYGEIPDSDYCHRLEPFDGCYKKSKNVWKYESSSSKQVLDNLETNFKIRLSQYLRLCRNVKYSLLKRYKPDDIYEVSRTSIPCMDKQ
ncbi:uncharacterized protein LOC112493781 isoform X2 [Cephus cinctus]|uniref:Uncharacterized protein LOC112493781 isoform X2 n=1 Tax=Cephus cinctus TaxID=211228 RepID=A0AAJ7RA54_CEPCN|nr:uncharacterized protein LOC112493781 isoform X2 [Cephus cinctus]